MKKTFKNKLIYLKYLLTSDELDDDSREVEWFSSRRLTWGYNIYNNQRNLNSGLCSKDCYEYIINGKGSKLVQDHFFGVTLSAEEVRKAFEESIHGPRSARRHRGGARRSPKKRGRSRRASTHRRRDGAHRGGSRADRTVVPAQSGVPSGDRRSQRQQDA